MKKLLSWTLCVLLLVTGLVGCGQDGPATSDGASSGDESTPVSDATTTEGDAADQTTSATVTGTDAAGSTTANDQPGDTTTAGSQQGSTGNKTQAGTTTKQPGGTSATPAIRTNWSGNTVELLNDPQFFNGFKCSGLINTDGYNGQVQFFGTDAPQ